MTPKIIKTFMTSANIMGQSEIAVNFSVLIVKITRNQESF
ncbi:hypothetical protein CsSME_00026545 [Camellia sinensis var. sinensis]